MTIDILFINQGSDVLKYLIIFGLCCNVISCGKLKVDQPTNSENSVKPAQVYTDSGILLGRYIGISNGGNTLILDVGNRLYGVDGSGYISGFISPMGVDSVGGTSCYYTSNDCSGGCYVYKSWVMKNSVYYAGTFYYATGNEVISTFTAQSSRTFNGGMSAPGSCAVASATINGYLLQNSWSLPAGVSYPITGIYIGE